MKKCFLLGALLALCASAWAQNDPWRDESLPIGSLGEAFMTATPPLEASMASCSVTSAEKPTPPLETVMTAVVKRKSSGTLTPPLEDLTQSDSYSRSGR